MANPNFCVQHQQKWFKTSKMKGYAHPIKDENGEDTGEWCNKPKEEEEKAPTRAPARDNTTNSSIEQQVAIKAIVELWIHDRIGENSQLANTAESWIMSKLSNWSSMGEVAKEAPDEPMINKLQLELIQKLAKEKGYTPANAVAIMVRKFNVAQSKALTQADAEAFIKILERGQYLEA